MTAPGLRPEAELVLAALSVGDGADARLRASLAPGPALDWDWIGTTVHESRVAPLVADALERVDFASVPEDVAELFRARARTARLRHLGHMGELLALARALAAADVEVQVYKGPALAELLYPDPGLREYSDLDVVVLPADLARAREVVVSGGWEPVEPRAGAALAEFVARDCEERFVRPGTGFLLELHWRFLPKNQPQRLDVEESWARSDRVTWAGTSLRVLEPSDLLLALCHHAGEKHRWMRLQMVADVARYLVRHRELDLDATIARANTRGLEDCVLVGLYLAWSWLDAPVPRATVERIAASTRLRARIATARGRVFRAEHGFAGRREWKAYGEDLAALERARGIRAAGKLASAAWLRELATPDWADRQSWPLPAGLRFLHWGWRPVRLALRVGGKLPERLR